MRMPALVAGAGLFPLRRADSASPLFGFKKRHGSPPTFWSALGHDAALLARVALRSLPTDRTEEASEVQARHRAASDALASAEADLWSTAARGFGSHSEIARDIAIIEAR
jgi:hypothetical protein